MLIVRVFKKDASFAPAYIFTLVDNNKDGVITSQTFQELVFDSQHKNITLDIHYNPSYDKKTFEKMLPDKVVKVENNSSGMILFFIICLFGKLF